MHCKSRVYRKEVPLNVSELKQEIRCALDEVGGPMRVIRWWRSISWSERSPVAPVGIRGGGQIPDIVFRRLNLRLFLKRMRHVYFLTKILLIYSGLNPALRDTLSVVLTYISNYCRTRVFPLFSNSSCEWTGARPLSQCASSRTVRSARALILGCIILLSCAINSLHGLNALIGTYLLLFWIKNTLQRICGNFFE